MKIDGLDWMDWLHKMRADQAKLRRQESISVSDAPARQARHRPLLYLETSVFGFCFDENARNALRREAAATLLKQIDLGLSDAVTSPLTFEELRRAHEPLRTKLLAAVGVVGQLRADKQEVEHLAAAYIRNNVIPQAFADDAGHVAYATIGKADLLVSLNLRHLANEWAERKIGAVNLQEGYQLLRIRTPEEVLAYEE
ncbi:MAG: hypothetical protein NTX53_09750 [candidate division WOR-3 bacterium]|nr:hypothetical protein [candidate division WOR-3 bacterium]